MTEVHVREVVPGELLVVGEGDRIPADARLVEATFLKVNNAPLTGESEPQVRVADADEAHTLFEAGNIVFAGTTVFSGSGSAVVFATGDATEFGKVARLTQEVPLHLSPLQVEIRRVTRVVTALSVTMGLSFFVLGSLIGRTFWENFIVANVPEGLLPTVTLALSMASQRMARRRALVKDLPAVEALGSTTVICTDKTGTLTQNRMAVRAISSRGRLFTLPALPSATGNPFLYLTFRFCNHASLEGAKAIGDPLEVALLQTAEDILGRDFQGYPCLYEVPFDPERKRMTTVHQLAQGTTAVLMKGAVESLLPLCTAVLAREGIVPLAPAQQEDILQAGNDMAGAALRVLGVAYKELPATPATFSPEAVEQDLIFAGLVGLMDPPRPEVAGAIQRCQEAGIRVIMITGDHRLPDRRDRDTSRQWLRLP